MDNDIKTSDFDEVQHWARKASKLLEEKNAITVKYNELINVVSMKVPNETRHETALRFITERENRVLCAASEDRKEL